MNVKKSALISDDGVFRYWLKRQWDDALKTLAWCCLNPSKADADIDDPSVRKMIAFSKLFGYGGLVLVNLFAFRSTDPAKVPAGDLGIGPDNDDWIWTYAREHPIVLAWGSHKLAAACRGWEVRKMLEDAGVREVYCLGKTNTGHPRHPLYVSYETALEPFVA